MSGIDMRSVVIYGPLLIPALLLLALAVARLFTMWFVDRLISGLELIIIQMVVVSLVGLAFMMDGLAAVGPIILLALVVGLVPLMPGLAGRIRARQLLREDILKYRAALERQPDVPYPHLKLAQIYEKREDWDRAIEHYRSYLHRHTMSSDARRRLERCLERRRMREMGLRPCHVCGAKNSRNNVRCEECGLYLKGSAEIVEALTTPKMMGLWRWLIVVFLVPGIAIGILGDVIPPEFSMILLSCSVVATLIFVYGRVLWEEES